MGKFVMECSKLDDNLPNESKHRFTAAGFGFAIWTNDSHRGGKFLLVPCAEPASMEPTIFPGCLFVVFDFAESLVLDGLCKSEV